METDGALGSEGIENLYNQMYDLFLEEALKKRGLDESEMHRFQVVFRSPFKRNQFEGLDSGDNDTEVRINDEVEAAMLVRPNRDVEAGEAVALDDIDAVEDIVVHDLGDDVGHVTFVWISDHLFTSFNFRYNEEYLDPLLEAADQFIHTAEYARENEYWRPFVENSLHAAERMMKRRIISHGDPAHDHCVVQSQYRKWVEVSDANEDLWNVYNQLKDKYRIPGSYVDPGQHPPEVDEKDFQLDAETADWFLEVIREHRDSLNQV